MLKKFIPIVSLIFLFIAPSNLFAQAGMGGGMGGNNMAGGVGRPPAFPSFLPQGGSGQSGTDNNSMANNNFAPPSNAAPSYSGGSNIIPQIAPIANPQIAPPSIGIVPVTTDSRIKTLVYNANEVYQLKFHYGYQSYIEFAESEDIEMISIGESFAWRLTPAGKRLFIRPLEIGAHTNMTVITNKRTYQFDIASAEYDGRADEELVYIVRFYYPEVGVNLPIPPQLTRPNAVIKGAPSKPIVKTPIPPQYVDKYLSQEVTKNEENLNFRYSIAGRADSITPLKVYDDGKETFFQFKDKNLIVPSISSVDLFGNEKPLGYAIREGFIVVSGTYTQFTLRLADSLLCIFNEQIAAAPPQARIDFYKTNFPKSTKP